MDNGSCQHHEMPYIVWTTEYAELPREETLWNSAYIYECTNDVESSPYEICRCREIRHHSSIHGFNMNKSKCWEQPTCQEHHSSYWSEFWLIKTRDESHYEGGSACCCHEHDIELSIEGNLFTVEIIVQNWEVSATNEEGYSSIIHSGEVHIHFIGVTREEVEDWTEE